MLINTEWDSKMSSDPKTTQARIPASHQTPNDNSHAYDYTKAAHIIEIVM